MSVAGLSRHRLEVLAMDELGSYRVLRVRAPAACEPLPGQFAMIAAAARWGGGQDERPFLARAFSLARERDSEWHFLLEDVGPGTRRLCELERGEDLLALAPLGRGFSPPAGDRRAILVGGGVGIAPLAMLQDTLGGPASVLLGFRDRGRAAGAALLADAVVATDDGSVGHHGTVTGLLAAELDLDSRAAVLACGPPAMLEAVRALCVERDVPAQLALEAPMACGFGACYGCVVEMRDGSFRRVCLDGPVFDAEALAAVGEHGGAV